jgi:predicted permease
MSNCLESLWADTVFGWRQLAKKKAASAAAVLSLALAIGSCTAAFRLIDALLLRPLPIAAPGRLYVVAFQGRGVDGKLSTYDSSSYPMFVQMRDAIRQQGDSIAVSYGERADLTYGSDEQMEKAYRQYVSGAMFGAFGLRPAAGRLLTENDDLKPGAHPVAVISYDYWARRFGREPGAVGRTFHMGDTIFQIVGITGERFTGTETGVMTDIFLPMMMKNPRTLASPTNFWLRTLVELKPGVAAAPVGERLRAIFRTIQEERVKKVGSGPKPGYYALEEKLLFEPASAGRSNLQRDYRLSMMTLGALVVMVLLIACANVANLKMAQAAARAREMALRISIGASQWRVVQMVLVENAWLAFLATAIGAGFAWWAAPFLIGRIDSPENPARILLPVDWRVAVFALGLALAVTFLFGMAPALRVSAVKPVTALKGGDDPHARRRLMHGLIALQVAFCLVVQFVAGLFVTTSDRLSQQPTGFSAARVLNLETTSFRVQPAVYWEQVKEHLRSLPGVESVGLTIWPMMSGESRISNVSVQGGVPTLADILNVSPGWLEAMRIPLLDGRDFRPADASPQVAIVNQAFAKQYFDGEDPVGKAFSIESAVGTTPVQVIGYIPDARSRDNVRLPIKPTAYFPFQAVDSQGAVQPTGRGTFVVRTASANPLALASILRQEVTRARPEFRVSNIRTQVEIDQSHTVRERMLAMLATFFALVALLLAGVGLYGVLDYSVEQRRREIGIRMAIGAQAAHIARQVTAEVALMVAVGGIAGLALGLTSMRFIESLLFEVKATDFSRMALPSLTILAAALMASLPAVFRAVRIDPASALRSE